MSKEISNGRKKTFKKGNIILLIGFLIFMSGFLAIIPFVFNILRAFNSPESFNLPIGSIIWVFISGPLGMILIITGTIIRIIGARGLAGSGVILDPKRAREECEPLTRMYGGMVKDALDEADISLSNKIQNTTPRETIKEIIKIKCQGCSCLNNDNAKFCQSCGEKL